MKEGRAREREFAEEFLCAYDGRSSGQNVDRSDQSRGAQRYSERQESLWSVACLLLVCVATASMCLYAHVACVSEREIERESVYVS